MNENEIKSAPPAQAVTAQKPFPGILPSIGWIVLYFLLQGLITAMLILLSAGPETLAKHSGDSTAIDASAVIQDPMVIMWGLVISGLLQTFLMWLYIRRGDRAQKLGLTHFGRLSFLRTLAVGAVLVVAALGFNLLYASYIIPGIGMQDEMRALLASIPRTPVNIAIGFLGIALIAPLVEELLFRGMLQNAFANKMPVWAAITLSAFLFSLVHMQPYAIPALMSLGMAFGYLYHRTGSLRTNILLHIANNSAALLLTQGMG